MTNLEQLVIGKTGQLGNLILREIPAQIEEDFSCRYWICKSAER